MKALRYLYYAFKNPGSREFIDMGLGIEARYSRCKEAWLSHLEASKRFQREAVGDGFAGRRVLILGSGRLLDIDEKLLDERWSAKICIDADPSAAPFARRRRADFLHRELTGSLNAWKDELTDFLKTWRKSRPLEPLSALLENFIPREVSVKELNPDVVLSVNLLSQIPLYWRDVVHERLKVWWGIEADNLERLPAELEQAVRKSMKALQAHHLRVLSGSGASKILLITDRVFRFKRGSASVHEEEALLVGSELPIDGYKEVLRESWSWDIAPEGVEFPDYGVEHEVLGVSYQREAKP